MLDGVNEMHTLYVTNSCPASKKALSMLANAPTSVQKDVAVSPVTGVCTSPPQVTAVPTLILQNGKMLVGEQVFKYLSKVRQNPHFPETPEMSENESFHLPKFSMSAAGFVSVAIVVFLIYWLWKNRVAASSAW